MTTISPALGNKEVLPSLVDLSDEVVRAKDFVDLIHLANVSDDHATARGAAHASEILKGCLDMLDQFIRADRGEVAK